MSTETIPAPETQTEPAKNGRKIRPGVLAIAAVVGLGAGLGIGALTDHPATAPDDATVQHTVNLPGGASVVVNPGDPLPAQVVTALSDPHGAFEPALRLETVTGSHVLLVEPHGNGAYASVDPLASGTGVVVADAPVADLALAEANEYTTAHPVAPDGFPWKVIDLTN